MRLVVQTFLTLDGVMQAPGAPDEDPSGGFTHGGWLVPFADADMGEAVTNWMSGADAFLLGRRTYDIFAAHWPRVTDPEDTIAAVLNGRPKYVVSRMPASADWAGTSVISGDVAGAVAELKEQPGGELQVHGSGTLARFLLANDLVDELRLITFPVMLGAGMRLVEGATSPSAFRLLGSRATSTGAIVASYERTGPATQGRFSVDEGTSAQALFAD